MTDKPSHEALFMAAPMTENSLLGAALEYAAQDIPVFPLHNPIESNNGLTCSCRILNATRKPNIQERSMDSKMRRRTRQPLRRGGRSGQTQTSASLPARFPGLT